MAVSPAIMPPPILPTEVPWPPAAPAAGAAAAAAGTAPGVERPTEVGGRAGPDPTRYGDWEKNGRCVDF
jgi:hypothetical protein